MKLLETVMGRYVSTTLRNDFHNTSAELKTRVRGGMCSLTTRQVCYYGSLLCGVDGCTCGDELGLRGPQELEWLPTLSNSRGHGMYAMIPE